MASQSPHQPSLRMGAIAVLVLILDQASKGLILAHLHPHEQRDWVPGFFRLVHWENTGAAWSMFTGSNHLLAGVAIAALVLLYLNRHHFAIHRTLGQVALGLLFGGIVGNLIDRFRHGHVVDFIYFYTYRRDGGEIGFPAFNVADTAICTGVGLLFLLSTFQQAPPPSRPTREPNEQRELNFDD